MTRIWTHRDAYLHSAPLRVFNRASALVGSSWPGFEPEAILRAAAKQAGCDDFGADSVREPLEVLAESIARDAKPSAFGRHGYEAGEFGLSLPAIRERYRDYITHYAIPEEG
jgi:hypothetical protein